MEVIQKLILRQAKQVYTAVVMLSLFCFGQFAYSQCTNIPVAQAVVNGDFEAGNTGFTTDYNEFTPVYCPGWTPPDYCAWSGPGDYLVDTANNKLCPGCWTEPGDHTSGTGNYLIVDGASTPGQVVWEQTVTVETFQTYYFSAWAVSLLGTQPAQLQFYVDGSPIGPLTDMSGFAVGTWVQISDTWLSGASTTATIQLINQRSGCTNCNDFGIDDISFINGCQNVSAGPVPDLGADFSICETSGNVTLNSGLSSGSGNFYWYEGTSNPQTVLVSADPSANTYSISSPGTYRVCFDDGVTCAASSTVVVDDNLNVDLGPDLDLCSPASYTLDAGVTGPALSYSWTVPGGATNPGNSQTATADVAGNYEVTVSGPSGAGPPAWSCSATDDVDVTSSLPSDPGTNTYCDGGGTLTTLEVDGVNNYDWWEDASGTIALSNSTTPGVTVDWTPPVVTTGDQTFYITSSETTPVPGGNPFGPSGSAHNVSPTTTDFSTYVSVLFQSFDVFVGTWTGGCGAAGSTTSITFEAERQSNSQVFTHTQTVNCGSNNTINAGWTLPADDYVLRAAAGTGEQFGYASAYEGTPTLYSISGVIDITGYGSANYQGQFKNWVIEQSAACDPVPVVVQAVACCANPAATASADFAVCEGDNLDVSVPTAVGGETYNWTGPNGFSGSTTSASINVSGSATTAMEGWYYVSITTAGCSSPGDMDSLYVTVNEKPTDPTITVNPNQTTFCEGETYDLTASSTVGSGTITYTWSGDGSGTTNPLSGTTTAGSYNYIVTATANGCTADNTGSQAITVNEKPTDPTITVNPNQTTFCAGEAYDLTASSTVGSGTITYTWSGDGSGTTNPLSGTTTAGSYNYIVTATANGCDADNTASQAITVNEKPTDPTITVNPNQTTFCAGEAYDLTASSTVGSGTITYTWSGDGSGTTNPLSGTTTAGSYNYIVTATANGCDADNTASQAITVNEKPTDPTITVNPNQTTFCEGETYDLTASSTVGSGTITYTWSGDGSGTTNPLSGTTTAGSYNYIVTATANGCDADNTASQGITVNAIPTATISGGGDICNDGVTTANLSIDFTGTAPFSVDVERNAGAFSTENTSSDPHTVTTTQDGTYTITNLSDGNCAGTTSGTATVSYYDDVVATASMECDDVNAALANDEFQIRVTVTQGDLASINITELTAHGVNFTDQGGGVWLSDAINETNSVDINVTDANDCNGGVDITGLQQQCSCPATGTITLTGSDPVCPGDNSSLEVQFSTTVGSGPFNVTVTHPISGASTTNSATSPLSITINEVGAYSATIEDVGNGCTVSATGSVSLSNHTPPTATISGTETICNDGVTTANLSIDFTGTAPFSVDVERNAGAFSTESTSSDPHTVTTTQDGTYTITNLSDGNCAGTTSGTATVSYYDDVVATAAMECDDVNAALANDEFQIRVTVTQGDLASINITELTAHGVNFTDQGGGVWLSDAVNELNSVDINVTDANDCNGGIDITGLQQQCTCPTTATATITGTNPICPGGSSTLEVSFAGGTGPFDVTLTEPSGTQNQTSVTSPATFTISDAGTYTATVTNNGDACDANTAGVDLTEHTPPTATISGTETICNDGVTTANLSIDFTGTAPFSVDVERNAGAFSTESTSSDPHTVTTTQDGTYTITNLSDGNCAGTTSGTATVSYYDDVVATAAMECDDVNAALADDEFQIRVTVTQGDLASINITELTAHGVNFADLGGGVWLSDAVNESNTVDINVTDANDCNGGIDITGLQRQCSCPTTATATITGSNPICPTGSSTLEVSFTGGTGPFDVTVTGPSGALPTVSGATSPETFTISDAGDYTVVVDNIGDACFGNDGPVTLSHHTVPTSTVSGGGTICDNGSDQATVTVTLTGTGPFNFTYDDGTTATPVTTSSNPHDILTMTAGTYTITAISDANCTGTPDASSATVTTVTPPDPQVNDPGTSFCDGQGSYTLSASNITPGNSYEWLLNGSSTGVTDQNITITDLSQSGTYTVRETSAVCGSVTSSTSSTVTVNAIPTVDAGNAPDPHFLGETSTLSGSSNGTTFSWTPAAEALTPTSLTTDIVSTTSQYFTLTASNGSCSSSDSVYVEVILPLTIPNVFTPNDDTENDTWVIDGLETYSNATVQVFNRWGNEVFKSIGVYEPWDGTRRGSLVPVHTYYYIIDLGIEGLPTYTGSVTLVR